MLHAPGKVEFKATQKELAGAAKVAEPRFVLPVASELHVAPKGSLSIRFAAVGADTMVVDAGWIDKPYTVYQSDGTILSQGVIATDGRIPRIVSETFDQLVLELGDPADTQLVSHLDTDDGALDPIEFSKNDDEETTESADKNEHYDNRYEAKVSADHSAMNDPFLGEEVVTNLLIQFGVTLPNDQP